MGWLSSKLDIRQHQRLQTASDRILELQEELSGTKHDLDRAETDRKTLRTTNEDLEVSLAVGREKLNATRRDYATAIEKQKADHEARSNRTLVLLETETATRFKLHREALHAEERAIRAERALALSSGKDSTPSIAPRYQNSDSSRPGQPFVVVLIDADAYWFQDKYVRAGKDGGSSVAQGIMTEVSNYVEKQPHIPEHCSIVARVYMNKVNACSMTTERLGENMMRPFDACLTNISQSFPLFDIIDCGVGKERVDHKIHATFNLFINNPQCYAIMLAACHDNGYVRLLEPYIGNSLLQPKIALITNGSIGSEFHDIMLPRGPLETMEWPSIFNQSYSGYSLRKFKGKRAIMAAEDQWEQSIQRRQSQGSQVTSASKTPLAPAGPSFLPDFRTSFSTVPHVQLLPPKKRLHPTTARWQRIAIDVRKNERVNLPWKSPSRPIKDLKFYTKHNCYEYTVFGHCVRGIKCGNRHEEVDDDLREQIRWLMQEEHSCVKGGKCRRGACTQGHQRLVEDKENAPLDAARNISKNTSPPPAGPDSEQQQAEPKFSIGPQAFPDPHSESLPRRAWNFFDLRSRSSSPTEKRENSVGDINAILQEE